MFKMFSSPPQGLGTPSQVQPARTVSSAFLRSPAPWPSALLCVPATAWIRGACCRHRSAPSAAAASGSSNTAPYTLQSSILRQRRRRSGGSVAIRQLPPLVRPQQYQEKIAPLPHGSNAATGTDLQQARSRPQLLIPLSPQPAEHTHILQHQQQEQQQQQQQQQQHQTGATVPGSKDAAPPKQRQRQRRQTRQPTANENIPARQQLLQQEQQQQQQQQQLTKLSDSINCKPAAAAPAAASPQPTSPVQPLTTSVHAATVAPAKPSWALAVDRRVAALPSTNLSTRSTTRSARSNRWGRHSPSQPAPAAAAAAAAATYSSMANKPAGERSSPPVASPSTTTTTSSSSSSMPARIGGDGKAVLLGPAGMLNTSSLEELMPGGELSAEGELQLCLAYQRYIQLQQMASQPHQQRQQQGDRDAAAPLLPGQASDLGDLLQDPIRVQQEGLLAQELLLQCFEPLLINRTKRVHSPHADFRELLAAARQGLLRAAARYDPQRVTSGQARLYKTADQYVRMALRDMLHEYQTAPVHVPSHIRELGAKLRRIERQLQAQRHQHSSGSISIEELAAAAGATVTQAQWALHATGDALQAVSMQSGVGKEKEDRGKAGSGVDLQQVDVSSEADSSELSGVVGAGGLTAARSGLHTEVDAAAERLVIEKLLQGLLDRLSPQDRHLLKLRLEGGSIAAAARELGKSSQWGNQAVKKVVERLREGVQQHAAADAEVAAMLSSY